MRAVHVRFARGLLLLVSIGSKLAGASPPVAGGEVSGGRHEPSTAASDPKRAKQLYATGVSELVAKDYPAAYKALSESYRLHPALETLYQLGVLANTQGRRVEAYDIMRRFAADKRHGLTAQGAVAYPHQTEVQRVLASTPDDTGELRIVGPPGALLLLDGRVSGTLPLSLPLLLRSGQHVISSEYGGMAPSTTVEILSGRTSELLFDLSGQSPKVSQRAETKVLISLASVGILNEQQTTLRKVLSEASTRSGLTVLDTASALIKNPELSTCIKQLGCKLQLAKSSGQEHILAARVSLQGTPTAGQWRVSVAWVNVAVGTIAAQDETGCTICAQEQASVLLEESAKRVIQLGMNRTVGRLQIKSTPAGATVVEKEHVIGNTPIDVAMYGGVHQLVVQREGFQPRRAVVAIESSQGRTIDLELLPLNSSEQKRQ